MSFMLETDLQTIAFKKEKLVVKVIPDRDEMGLAAAEACAATIKELLNVQDEVNMIFAAAPSQKEFLYHLCTDASIDWSRINAFHMDEYVGLGPDHPQGFGFFLREHIFGKVNFRSVHYINGVAADVEEECRRYTTLLDLYPVDIVCMGIGENGHIAFNDPGVADFNDPAMVKIARLDQICRQQQVHDKCFYTIDDVPQQAFTLTVPALVRSKYHYCVVPTEHKAHAVYETLNGNISEHCPASILRTCDHAILYLDKGSAIYLDI